MHLVNILRIITFSFFVGRSILTISDFNSFRFFGTPCRAYTITNMFADETQIEASSENAIKF
jgi:hypothetical protein